MQLVYNKVFIFTGFGGSKTDDAQATEIDHLL